MGKMVYLMMAVISVQIAMFLVFDVGIPTSSLWELFMNPQSWDSLSLTALIGDTLTLVSVGAIIVGTFLYKSDFIVFAGMAGVFYTFGKQLSTLYQNIYSQPSFGDATSAPIVAAVIVGPIVFLYILTVLEWWRGRD